MDFLLNLRRRAEILRRIRAFFDERDFVEVTTPVAIAAPAPEPHIDCPTAFVPSPSAAGAVAKDGFKFLRASPELQMKKLLAAGMDRIYQIGPCFREGELGARHHPEFTMIEWYRRNADYREIMADMEKLLSQLFHAVPTVRTGRAPRPAVPPPAISFRRLAVRDAYRRFAGWDPWVGEWDQDRFDYDMATRVEPNLGEGLVFLVDYPKEAASLALLRGDVAERWELYCNGIELANCFTELCDGPEQRRRFVAAKEERRRLGESDYPLDEEFLETVPLMKSASGVALGIDRLVAVLCGETDIHAVMCGE